MVEDPAEDLKVVSSQDSKNWTFWGHILVLLIGFLIGSSFSLFLSQKTKLEKTSTQLQQEVSEPRKADFSLKSDEISEEELPIGLELLQNPIVYQWRGSVQGKVIAKGEHSLTLENDKGNKINLTDKVPSGEIFRTVIIKNGNRVSFMDLDYGDRIVGEFWIFPGGKNTPVAGVLEVKNE